MFDELSAIVLNDMTTYVTNRKASFNFELLDTVEAGLVLAGHEVKSVRTGKAKLEGGHAVIRGGEAFLVGISIAPYQPSNTPKNYDPERPRKLLLSRKELVALEVTSEQKGLTLVPIRLYNNGRNLKVEIAVARGKKKFDKRETIKKRDTKRDIERTLKSQ